MKKRMKILFLNPQIDAEHKITEALREKGAALLTPADVDEAWQMLQLHGTSVDLAIIHKEGLNPNQKDVGLLLVSRIKADPVQADLPLIVTTDLWDESECAQHQEGPDGANAYLKAPFEASALLDVIDAVLGSSAEGASGSSSSGESSPSSQIGQTGEFVLEDASNIFLQSETYEPSDTSIRLEAPLAEEPSLQLPEAQDLSRVDLMIPTAVVSLEELKAKQESSSLKGAEIEAPSLMKPEGSSNSMIDGMALVPAPEQESLSEIPVNLEFEEPSLQLVNTQASQEVFQGEEDLQAAQEMPYLYGHGSQLRGGALKDPSILFAEPMGDAVVPGGAAQAPDLETFKKYLFLREQDVGVLSTQLKAAQDQIKIVEQSLREERAQNAEMTHLVAEQKKKIDDFEKERSILLESHETEINELRFQLKTKTDKARVLDLQAKEISVEMDHLKERVRADIRKIRVREKELENRLEIMKKDSEALIAARENKIIELKRKLDLLEFNMDLLQDQYSREKESSSQLRERLNKAAQVVRVAEGLLDSKKGEEARESNESG
jgi:CheY-like chemotaxis protein